MARLDEIAEGIAVVLVGSPQPESLPVSFRGHSPAEIAFLVRAVVDACDRMGRPLAYLRVPGDVAAILSREPGACEATIGIRGGLAQPDAVEFGRFPEGG